MLHQKLIPVQEKEKSTEKVEYQYFNGKQDENKGVIEYGNDFKKKNFSDKNST